MLLKKQIFILFIFENYYKIFSYTNCCCYYDNKNKEKNNNLNNNKENNEKINKDDEYENLDDILKNNDIYKKDYKESKFKWNDNNCTIKTSLLNLMLFFDYLPVLYEDIKKEENIKCEKAKKEAIEFINEIINIREKYLKGENLIKMEDFYKKCHDYKYKFYKEIKDDELDDIDKLKEIEEENIYLSELLGFSYQLDDMLTYYNENNKELFNSEKEAFKDYRDNDLEESYYKEYRTDFECGCSLDLILELLSKLIKDFKVIHYPAFYQIIYKKYIFQIKKNLEVKNNLISIKLHVKYKDIGHSCLIYKDKNNNKYYFDCCNKVIEIDFEDVKNKNFQKILDIWYKKTGSYKYTFDDIREVLYLFKTP